MLDIAWKNEVAMEIGGIVLNTDMRHNRCCYGKIQKYNQSLYHTHPVLDPLVY